MPYRGIYVVGLFQLFFMATHRCGHIKGIKAAEFCGKTVWRWSGATRSDGKMKFSRYET
jgi:hypothetical protein